MPEAGPAGGNQGTVGILTTEVGGVTSPPVAGALGVIGLSGRTCLLK